MSETAEQVRNTADDVKALLDQARSLTKMGEDPDVAVFPFYGEIVSVHHSILIRWTPV
ncbi:MAG: hypothetical protein KAJ98_00620 [Spirochaetaceae bacterium]|nr:hypothetical protein [Spirochaetaceae bacterium]